MPFSPEHILPGHSVSSLALDVKDRQSMQALLQEANRTHGARAWLTAFLDIPGTTTQLLRFDQLQHDVRLRASQVKVLLDPLGQYQALRMIGELYLSRVPPLCLGPRPADAGLLERVAARHRAPEYLLQRLGDSLVFSVPFTPDPDLGDYFRVFWTSALFSNLSTLMLSLLSERVPLRGGVDIGISAKYSFYRATHAELVGASLVKAYKLESSVAQWPRIAIGRDLLDALSRLAGSADGSVASLAGICLSLCRRDIDGTHSLDYLSQAIDGPHHPDTLRKAREFVTSQVSAFTEAGDRKLAERYSHVEKYFSSTLGPQQ